jgi:hypothetical protein
MKDINAQMNTEKKYENYRKIIALRYLVGFLGEKQQCHWWSTSFYEASSTRFLEPVFARSAPLAQYQGVLEAARRFHDENLSADSFHIFRLPEEVEQDIHEIVQIKLVELLDPSWTADRSSALSALSKLTDGSIELIVGPVLVGKIDEVHSPAMLDKIGIIYHVALSTDVHALPYMLAS